MTTTSEMTHIGTFYGLAQYDLDCYCGDPDCEPLYVRKDVGAMAQHMVWSEPYMVVWELRPPTPTTPKEET